MLQKGLVSVISPCYNGENYIRYFLDSLLIQDYRPIEVFLVDDGSTDNTYNIAKEYEDRFSEKGIGYTILRQENLGATSAINKALPLINGEFLTWPDSDDILYTNNISEKVKALSSDETMNFTMCSIDLVRENNREKVYGKLNVLKSNNLIYNFMNFRRVFYAPIGFMVRTQRLFDIYHDKNVIVSPNKRIGQNMQIILPCLHNSNYTIIKNSLGKYVVRSESHSRKKNSYDEMLIKINDINSLFLMIFDRLLLSDIEQKKYKEYVLDSDKRLKLNLYYEYDKADDFMEEYNMINNKSLKLEYLHKKLMLSNNLYRFINSFIK